VCGGLRDAARICCGPRAARPLHAAVLPLPAAPFGLPPPWGQSLCVSPFDDWAPGSWGGSHTRRTPPVILHVDPGLTRLAATGARELGPARAESAPPLCGTRRLGSGGAPALEVPQSPRRSASQRAGVDQGYQQARLLSGVPCRTDERRSIACVSLKSHGGQGHKPGNGRPESRGRTGWLAPSGPPRGGPAPRAQPGSSVASYTEVWFGERAALRFARARPGGAWRFAEAPRSAGRATGACCPQPTPTVSPLGQLKRLNTVLDRFGQQHHAQLARRQQCFGSDSP
jgi:hypothetical protein